MIWPVWLLHSSQIGHYAKFLKGNPASMKKKNKKSGKPRSISHSHKKLHYITEEYN